LIRRSVDACPNRYRSPFERGRRRLSKLRRDRFQCLAEYQEECNFDSISSCKLFKKHLAVKEIIKKFAFAVGQVRFANQSLNLVAPHVLKNRAVVEQIFTYFRIVNIQERKYRSIKSYFAPTVQYLLWNDPAHGIPQDSLRHSIADQMPVRNAITEFEEFAIQKRRTVLN